MNGRYVDSLKFLVMICRACIGAPGPGFPSTWSAPQTDMMLDVVALRYLYGADVT